jgi:hypothetical protein
MTPTPLHALKSLSELALAAPAAEPLIIYDSVTLLALKLGETASLAAEDTGLRMLADQAAVTAEAIRTADRHQIDFQNLLGGAER